MVDDDGEFMLKFSGVEFGQTTKELSILEAMVDAEYISAFSVNSIKKLNSSEAQNSFYSILYKDLKTNLNTLRAEGLTKIQAIRGTLNEMANELLAYGVNNTLPDRINGCNSDSVCIGQEMEKLSSRLIIDTNESAEIVNTQKDNTAPMSVRNVSCEEEKSDSTRLTKMTDYNSDGSKLWEGNLIYENDKLKKWVWNDYEDEGESGIWIYEYSTDKIKIVDSDNSSSWEYLYKNSVITEWNWYNEGTLFFSDKIVEYDEQNRPIKIEQRLSLEADIDYIETYTYDGEYLIHNESIDQDIEYSDFSDYSDYKYDRNYKCITWKDLTGTPLWNNQECINWISKTTTEKENDEKDINTQEIIYNDKELPTRIDSYDTNGEQSEHTYSIFEYSD
ncbi:Chitinase [hydrothermal vent metagenome]|uniref:Chitinase n=1 Tax=hydrothermal vent metagenome TaxID=652676 RepID=A0A1W1C492_9ZZZZ